MQVPETERSGDCFQGRCVSKRVASAGGDAQTPADAIQGLKAEQMCAFIDHEFFIASGQFLQLD